LGKNNISALINVNISENYMDYKITLIRNEVESNTGVKL